MPSEVDSAIFWQDILGTLVSPYFYAPSTAIQNGSNLPVWFWLRQRRKWADFLIDNMLAYVLG